jgi:hypothetical protein
VCTCPSLALLPWSRSSQLPPLRPQQKNNTRRTHTQPDRRFAQSLHTVCSSSPPLPNTKLNSIHILLFLLSCVFVRPTSNSTIIGTQPPERPHRPPLVSPPHLAHLTHSPTLPPHNAFVRLSHLLSRTSAQTIPSTALPTWYLPIARDCLVLPQSPIITCSSSFADAHSSCLALFFLAHASPV